MNGQRPDDRNGERKDPVSEAIDALEDGSVKTELSALAEAVDAAIRAEMEAREAGEKDLTAYEEAVREAQDALMQALQAAGIELQQPEEMNGNERPDFNGQQPPEMNGQAPQFNGQEPPEKPEGDLKPEIPANNG